MEFHTMYSYGYGTNRLSSVPSHLTAPNGLNFSRSIRDPWSNLNRVRRFLEWKGEATKAEILKKCFNRTLDNTMKIPNRTRNYVTSGWNTYLFGYGIRHGYFKKVRRGNVWYWSNV